MENVVCGFVPSANGLGSVIDASRVKRGFNHLVDTAMVLVIQGILQTSFVAFTSAHSEWAPKTMPQLVLFLAMYAAILLGGAVSYYVVCEYFLGQTLGKAITGTRVIDENGAPIGFRAAVIRNVIRFLPIDTLSFLRRGKRGLHDRLANTRVVDVRAR